MAKRRRGRHQASVELTPLIDVVFLLLIFFMVSTTFVRETALKINLAEADGEVQEDVQEEVQETDSAAIEITIDRAGDYAVNSRLLANSDKQTLVRALQEVIPPQPLAPRLVIAADALAAHQAVIRAMDAAASVGLTQVSMTTRQPQAEE